METATAVKQIGKYEILSELGRGGMGVVYRAEDKFIGREVAIKTLTEATPELRQRFLVEARAGVLNHQNIVTVFDFGEQDGSPYIVMEYLRGQSLERLLKEGEPLQVLDKLEIVRQSCDALGYAHSKGVIHRDIKPANIMVQPDGHVKIVDFGIARLESASGNTATGAVIGTFHYISPERLKGESSDGRADIWAAGVVLYQLLTGRLPFPGEDVSSLHKVVSEPFEPLSNFISGYPEALDGIIDRALAKNPDERYSSAEEMSSDLENITEGMKRSRVGEVLVQVKGLMEQQQLTNARPMLLDLQRIDPQNTEVRRLLRDVQDRLSKQQRSEQVRQLLQAADDAARDRKYGEALDDLNQAVKLDPTNRGLTDRVQQLRDLKKRFDQLESLKNRARDDRHRGDFKSALGSIGEALELDPGNTDLRNEKARIVLEQDRVIKDESRRKLKATGRDRLDARQFTEAIKVLGEALDLDPTDADAQQMYQSAVAKQEEERRRKIIDQIVLEIQDQIFRGQLERALDLIARAQEKLPGEAVLLRLKNETQKKHEEATTQKLVEATSIRVQALFFSAPQEALAVVQQALLVKPGEARLLELEERVVSELKRSNIAGLRAQYLTQAQAAVDARNYGEAIRVLETAALDCGEGSEIQALLEYARSEKQATERHVAATKAIREGQELISAGELELAIVLLKRAVQDTPDAALDRLLKQSQERFDEVGRKVEGVIKRIRELAERDPANALELLQSQPQAIQLHPEMKALRARLDSRGEQQRVITEATAKSSDELRQGKLREGLLTLETVRRAYGDSPQITDAIARYKAKRSASAISAVTQAVGEARRVFAAGEAQRAMEILDKAVDCVEFAGTDQRQEFNELVKAVANAPGLKATAATGLIVVKESKVSRKLVLSLAAVLVVAIAAAAFFLRKPTSSSSSAVISTGTLKLNASPWAEVVSVTPVKGESAIALPEGDHSTPMLIGNLPEGAYTVLFKSGSGAIAMPKECKVTAESTVCEAALSSQPISDSDIARIVKGGQ